MLTKIVRRRVRISAETAEHSWSKLWAYSYADLANLFDTTPQGVRLAVTREQIDPSSLTSICKYWAEKQSVAESTRLTPEEFIRLRGQVPTDNALRHWQRRWPRFEAYRCRVAGCTEILLDQGGACLHHGGAKPVVTLGDDDHFFIRVGSKDVPICQIIFGLHQATEIHHLDGNTWNSHPDNLQVISHIAEPELHTPGVRRKRWAYGYRELGDLFELTEDGASRAAHRGRYKPESLRSVIAFAQLRERILAKKYQP